MAKFVKLNEVKNWSDPSKDVEVWVNPDFVQYFSKETSSTIELMMQGHCMCVRGELDEIAEKLSSNNNRRIY